MNRTLLIARREYAAYAKTVGFWLSLLALPLGALVAGGMSFMAATSEPMREIAVIEEGPQAAGLGASVRDALARDADRRARRDAEARDAAREASGGMAAPQTSMMAQASRQRIRLAETPAEITVAAPGAARDAVARRLLSEETSKDDRLDAIVFLNRVDGQPAARVWAARTTDDTVEDFVRDALVAANRQSVFSAAGIDPGVVERAERFRPDVAIFSPKAADGGEVSWRDRLPLVLGLGGGFLLWSLIITGASILLNSVMEEKSNKILEVLLSSASATEILTGKVLGVALLTLTVLAGWALMGVAGLIGFAPQHLGSVADILFGGGMLWWFVAFMVGGYLMYAVIFAAIGAFCETPRDAQTLMGPIMMVLVIPMITMQMAVRTPDAPIVQMMSWIPFFTPFLMMARLPSDPPMLEVLGAILGMFAFALAMVWVAGRAFRAGALSDVKLSWKSFMGAVRGQAG